MGPYLLDTGVLLRLLDASDPLHVTVRKAVRLLRAQPGGIATTFQNVCEFWNVSTRPATARGGLGLELSKVARQVRLIDRWCPVLADSPTIYPVWRRLVATYSVTGASVHDARLVATMQVHNIQRILTLNERDFRRYEPEGIQGFIPSDVIGP